MTSCTQEPGHPVEKVRIPAVLAEPMQPVGAASNSSPNYGNPRQPMVIISRLLRKHSGLSWHSVNPSIKLGLLFKFPAKPVPTLYWTRDDIKKKMKKSMVNKQYCGF